MSQTITITGQTTVGGVASTITLTNAPPIKSILAGELIVAAHMHAIAYANSAIVAGANNTLVKDGAGTGVEVSGAGVAFSDTGSAAQATRAVLAVVLVTPTVNLQVQRLTNSTISLYLTTALTVNDVIVLQVEERGGVVRP